jgi:uncharacterized cupredoxin-like copper-binding protein
MFRSLLTCAALLVALPGCAPSGDAASAEAREVTVTMGEFWFESSDSIFTAGVPYRFVLQNVGQMPHEWAVVPRGDVDESRLLFEVEEEELPPGATVVREFTFPEAGEFDFACYLPGHYEGGMVLPIRVATRR